MSIRRLAQAITHARFKKNERDVTDFPKKNVDFSEHY